MCLFKIYLLQCLVVLVVKIDNSLCCHILTRVYQLESSMFQVK